MQCTLAMRIVRAAVDPEVSVLDLAQMAQRDAAFALRMLRVVNSAAFGLTHKVTDIRRAASMLGVRGVRNIALSLSLCQMAPIGDDGVALLAVSLRRGIAARLVAEQLGERERLDDYFTVGLLLETGLLAIAADDVAVAARIARAPAVARPVQERMAGFVPHAERGAELAETWQLSVAISDAIRSHHDEEPPLGKVARVAWVAERVAAVFEGGDVVTLRRAAVASAATLGIDEERVTSVLERLPTLVSEAALGFEREVGEQPDIDQLVNDAAAQLVDMNERFQEMIWDLERALKDKDELTRQLQEANERLARQAAIDGLTGLANHRTFQDSLRRDLSRAARAGTTVSLVMLDVDHFKRFNDNYGHPAGDAVLRAVSQLLVKSTRDGDLAARYGGEEFALILPDADAQAAVQVAERLRETLASMRVKLKGKRVQVTASFGVATVVGGAGPIQARALVRAADTALYAAKHAGRNRVHAVPVATTDAA